VYRGSEASEPNFKMGAPGKEILHLATHGFFMGGKCSSTLDRDRGVTMMETILEDQALRPVVGDDPMLLSGLAMAGANHRDKAAYGEDDGILTAEEIGAMDLTAVDWAVLSACDTGLGEVETGEGVFGLRRAFRIAGARTLITSLWSVEDAATREWMRELYQARFLGGLGAAESVREAGRAVLSRRRAEGESTHPFYWGAFVASGDWR
jgi:CHAT domain-containing protein